MKQLIPILLFLLVFSAFNTGNAQVSYGGEPLNWTEKDLNRIPVIIQIMPAIDLAAARAEDEVTDAYKETPYRFGIEHEVDINFTEEALAEELDQSTVYRLGISCPGASSVSFVFDRFDIPQGDQVFVYNSSRDDFLGAFDSRNKNAFDGLAVGIHPYETIIIEYIQNGAKKAKLHISQVVHGYRSILNKWEDSERGPFGNSGSCNINVNCPEGEDWAIESKSVALIVSGGNAVCTGALVNNTAQDGTPYFLTANHCLGGNVGNWIFYFNHETSGCGGNSGPTNQSISGSVLRASNGGSDFGLLELNDVPPANYDVQYAGWDRSASANVSSAVGIHHPSGDVKKICFENDSPYQDNVFGTQVWWIDDWEAGVTEGGSSGSPLFNQNHRIIGQLYGGLAACSGNGNNGQYDYYGRFDVSWNSNSASTRLRDWLDPLGTNPQFLDGWPQGAEVFALDGLVSSGNGQLATICGDSFLPVVNVVNQGTSPLTSATISYSINGLQNSIPWTGNLAQNESEAIELPAVTLINGNNELIVTLLNPNGTDDQNASNNSYILELNAVAGAAVLYGFNLTQDDWGSEITWEFENEQGILLYTGGPYEDDNDGVLIAEEICLSEGCYTFTIFDDFGDGICCQYGLGSYEIVDEQGSTVASGAEYGDSESVEFCVTGGNSVAELKSLDFKIYPNPGNGMFNIDWAAISGNVGLEIIDHTGRTVNAMSINTDGGSSFVDASQMASGVYIVRVFNENYSGIQRLIIK